ncbi:potassium transporter TrkG [Pyruvatibacter sp.]
MFAIIGIVLAASLSVIALAHLLPVLVAVSAGDNDQAIVFAMTGLLTAFIAGALGFATGGQKHRPVVAERLTALSIVWLIVPGFAAIAFVGVDPKTLYVDAYFDAVSALTTTGSISLINELSSAPAVMIWRATLQWIGGYATLLMSMLVLAQLGLAGLSLRRAPIPPGDTSGPFGRYWPAMVALGLVYGSVTLAGVIGLLVGGMALVPAIGLAFSAAATGGLMPNGGTVVTSISVFSGIVVATLLLLGATNYLRHAGLVRRSPRTYWEDPEFRYMVLGITVGGIVLAGLVAITSGASLPLINAIMWMLSLLSTSVFAVDEAGFGSIPLLVALAVVFVGGSTMSTAGGLKLMRIAILMKQGSREIARLSHPHGIVHTDFGGRSFTMPLMRGVWTMFVLMLVFALLTALALTVLGVPFEHAITASIGALSNAGPVLGFATGIDGAPIGVGSSEVYAAMPATAKLVLSLAMVAGRVELLAFVGVVTALTTQDS